MALSMHCDNFNFSKSKNKDMRSNTGRITYILQYATFCKYN